MEARFSQKYGSDQRRRGLRGIGFHNPTSFGSYAGAPGLAMTGI